MVCRVNIMSLAKRACLALSVASGWIRTLPSHTIAMEIVYRLYELRWRSSRYLSNLQRQIKGV